MNLGQPKHLRDLAKSGFNQAQKLKDGENVHRVLFGPGRVERIWFPVLVEDEGKMVVSRRTVKRPPEGCTLDFIANLEIRIRQQLNQDKPTSVFSPKTEFLYLSMNQGSEEALVELFSFPYSVYKRLLEIEKERDTRNPQFLRHGLIWMYDVIIAKLLEKGKSRRWGTSYEVQVDTQYNVQASKTPVSWLDRPVDEILAEMSVVEAGIFTENQWKAIVESDIDLMEEIEPDSQADILALLKKCPIYLDAQDENGNHEFPERDFLAKELTNAEIPFVREDSSTQVAIQEQATEEQPKIETREESEAVEKPETAEEIKKDPLPPPPVDADASRPSQNVQELLNRVRTQRGQTA